MIELSQRELLAIEAAAEGRVSGSLEEWPYLNSALIKCGYELPDSIGSITMRKFSQQALIKLRQE